MNIIFDYDGTLHNTKLIYGAALREAYKYLEEKKLVQPKEISDDLAASFLGFSPDETWNILAPGLNSQIKSEIIQLTGENMDMQIKAGKSQLYSGVENVLSALKNQGHRMYILSNCTEYYMESHRKGFNLDRFITGYYPAERYGYIPKPEIFNEIKKDAEKNISSTKTDDFIVIGDRFHDIQVAKIHNLHSVGCLYGFGSAEELADSEYLIDSIKQLPHIIEKINQ